MEKQTPDPVDASQAHALQSNVLTERKPSRPIEGVCRRCGVACASAALVACPDCGGPIAAAAARRANFFDLPAVRYPNAYVWFVFVSAMDVILTWLVLVLAGGQELNPIADAVIAHGGLKGLVLFKFCLVVLVVVMCEWIGRRNARAGSKLSEWSVAITAIPVVVSFALLLSAT